MTHHYESISWALLASGSQAPRLAFLKWTLTRPVMVTTLAAACRGFPVKDGRCRASEFAGQRIMSRSGNIANQRRVVCCVNAANFRRRSASSVRKRALRRWYPVGRFGRSRGSCLANDTSQARPSARPSASPVQAACTISIAHNVHNSTPAIALESACGPLK